jgi:hypothetical protein
MGRAGRAHGAQAPARTLGQADSFGGLVRQAIDPARVRAGCPPKSGRLRESAVLSRRAGEG